MCAKSLTLNKRLSILVFLVGGELKEISPWPILVLKYYKWFSIVRRITACYNYHYVCYVTVYSCQMYMWLVWVNVNAIKSRCCCWMLAMCARVCENMSANHNMYGVCVYPVCAHARRKRWMSCACMCAAERKRWFLTKLAGKQWNPCQQGPSPKARDGT